ncbi:MAG: M14 family metallopeptidase [Longimicrobiales bacterium]|nr:M14 family metallopeptidase [Longimicrobiales bacterium]
MKSASLAFVLTALLTPLAAASQVPTPEQAFGFPPGADYKVADYDQMKAYFHALAEASPRASIQEIGLSAKGQPLLLLIISSEANMRRVDEWRGIAERLARAEIGENEAKQLASMGKAVVWVDGGMDDQEYATAQMTPELAYTLITSETEEMRFIRENVVILLNPILNPDATVNDVSWYRQVLGTPYETTRPPRMGQPWAGTDNNRDWFMNNQPETRAVSKILYRTWYPQIVYNQHQPAPNTARIFIPPFADPVNPDIHPLVTTGVNMVGAAMAARFASKHMPGYVSNAVYSMWWNGGMRLTPYFHNQVGILTETAHRQPTPRLYDPDRVPEILPIARGVPARTDSTSINYPDPWRGTESHIRDAFDYMQEATYATLDLAARYRERFLFNVWRMGRDAIEKGEAGGPWAYVVPTDQWDPGEAVNLVNVFRHSGVEVHKASRAFQADGREYPAGSYVIYTAQAFRPHVVNLLETRPYPERRLYPGGPPETPYDLAGWTLPMQMGVTVERVERPFQARTDEIAELEAMVPGQVSGDAAFGYAFGPRENAAHHAANRLMAAGHQVWLADAPFTAGGSEHPAGSFVVAAGAGVTEAVRAQAQELGVDFAGVAARPSALAELRRPRVGLYKAWHSRVDDQGWTLWLMEQYDFAVDTLHDADIRRGDLSAYDAIVLPNHPGQQILQGNAPGTMPDEYVGGVGTEGVTQLKRYVEGGGTLIAFDQATDLPMDHFGIPVRNAVAGLDPQEFFVPGSLIRTDVDTGHLFAAGMQGQVAAAFSQSRAFEIVTLPRSSEGGMETTPEAPAPAVEVVARYAEKDLLMSGWATGEQRHLAGRPAMVNVRLGSGNVVLFGFKPQFRGQPRGTYKLLFNAIQRAATGAKPVM